MQSVHSLVHSPGGRLAYEDKRSQKMTLSQQASSNILCSFSTQPRAVNLNLLLIPNWPNAPAINTSSVNTADERPVSNYHTHVGKVAFHQVLSKGLRPAPFQKYSNLLMRGRVCLTVPSL